MEGRVCGVRTCVRVRVGARREATILHADLDAFYASVEQRDDPALRGRPVIVGGGVVLAASYEAKAMGVRTAMGGRQARACCPDAVVVAPRMSAYSEASKAVFEVFRDTTPLVEGLSIDEAFLDVGGLRRVSGTPEAIAARLRSEVRERVGLPITVGVARTKFLAKVASAVGKPDGLLVVPPDDELAFLHPLPVERVWGVGAVTAVKLHGRGIFTVGELAAVAGGRAGRRSSGPRPAGTSTRSPTTATRGGSRTGRAAPLGGRPAGARALGGRPGGGRRVADRARRPRHPAAARRRAGGAHRGAAAAVRRLRPRDPLAHRRPGDRGDPRRCSASPAVCSTSARPEIARRGCTLIGVAVSNLVDADPLQLALPFERRSPVALDAALDGVRERFGTAAVTRGVLLRRGEGLSVPTLPD